MQSDKTPKVTGIGGIFFLSDDVQQTREWYAKNLGLEFNDWGSVSFESRLADNPHQTTSLQWTPFRRDSEYFKPSDKEFMINYRVQNLDGVLENLKNNGVQILDEVAEYDFGRFVHIMDAHGTKIELWEPK